MRARAARRRKSAAAAAAADHMAVAAVVVVAAAVVAAAVVAAVVAAIVVVAARHNYYSHYSSWPNFVVAPTGHDAGTFSEISGPSTTSPTRTPGSPSHRTVGDVRLLLPAGAFGVNATASPEFRVLVLILVVGDTAAAAAAAAWNR